MKKRVYFTIILLSLCLCGCVPLQIVEYGLREGLETQSVESVEDTAEEMQEPSNEEILVEQSEATEESLAMDETESAQIVEGPKASYIADDGSIVRMSAEELTLKEEAVWQAILALPAEKPESTLTQDQLDEATVQWFNTTYSVMMYQNHFDYTLIGGEKPGGGDNVYFLERDWGVTDRASAIDNLCWLLESGHRADYEQTVEEFIYYGLFDVSLEDYLTAFEISAQEQEIDFNEIKPYFTNIYVAYQECGEAGVKAWDYCRIMQMCGDYYAAGYFTLEECMEISLAMAQLLQAEYVSWEDMMNSFLYGYYYWRAEDPEEQGTGSYWRRYFYNELYNLEDSPYTTYDWNMEFVINWR